VGTNRRQRLEAEALKDSKQVSTFRSKQRHQGASSKAQKRSRECSECTESPQQRCKVCTSPLAEEIDLFNEMPEDVTPCAQKPFFPAYEPDPCQLPSALRVLPQISTCAHLHDFALPSCHKHALSFVMMFRNLSAITLANTLATHVNVKISSSVLVAESLVVLCPIS
jgi:hypothetical protein